MVTLLSATLVPGTTNRCLVNYPVPAGATPFTWNNSYYVAADKSNPPQCPAGSNYDGPNCWYKTQPSGGFQVKNSFYVPGTSTTCPGSYDANAGACLDKTAPWGTHAFVWTPTGQAPQWYFTTYFTCKAGGYDGANYFTLWQLLGVRRPSARRPHSIMLSSEVRDNVQAHESSGLAESPNDSTGRTTRHLTRMKPGLASLRRA